MTLEMNPLRMERAVRDGVVALTLVAEAAPG